MFVGNIFRTHTEDAKGVRIAFKIKSCISYNERNLNAPKFGFYGEVSMHVFLIIIAVLVVIDILIKIISGDEE